jgi:hypothetical protein
MPTPTATTNVPTMPANHDDDDDDDDDDHFLLALIVSGERSVILLQSTRQLNVLGHDGHTPRMNGTQICTFKQIHEIGFGSARQKKSKTKPQFAFLITLLVMLPVHQIEIASVRSPSRFPMRFHEPFLKKKKKKKKTVNEKKKNNNNNTMTIQHNSTQLIQAE